MTRAQPQLIESVADAAQRCSHRDYLAMWFERGLVDDDLPMAFGQTEKAIVDSVLERVAAGDSLLIKNPLPCNRVPLAILLAYIRAQDSRFPTNGIVGQGKQVLAFPAHHLGYLSTLDNIRESGIGTTPAVVDRQPIGVLSETAPAEPDMFSAKSNFVFDWDTPGHQIGLCFVDLRKPEWGNINRRFDQLKSFIERATFPVVFYADEGSPVTDVLASEFKQLEVTPDLLETATGETPQEGVSTTTHFEQLLTTGEFEIEHLTVYFPELRRVTTDMVQMKDDLQERGIATMRVGWLFNLLTKGPVQPKYWDAVIEDNFYQQSAHELIGDLRSIANKLDGMDAELLLAYTQAASHLHSLLNQTHPIQKAVFSLIEGSDETTNRAIVVKNELEREAILEAVTMADGPETSGVDIVPLDELTPGTYDEAVVVRPLDYDSYAYDFPIAEQLMFISLETWAGVTMERLRQGIGTVESTIAEQSIGTPPNADPGPAQSPQPPSQATREAVGGDSSADGDATADDVGDQQVPPTGAALDDGGGTDTELHGSIEDALEIEIDEEYTPRASPEEESIYESLKQELEAPSDERGHTGSSTETTAGRADLELVLDNGETRQVSRMERASMIRDGGEIRRVRAQDLSVGDRVVLVEHAATDIYEMFLANAHEQEKLRKCESVIERWRSVLQDAREDGWTLEELLAGLQENGSEIVDVQTVKQWCQGDAIGPQQEEDVTRVLELLQPELADRGPAMYRAMKHIRTEHRQIGKKAKQVVELQASGDTDQLPESIPSAAADVETAQIVEISELEHE